MIINSPLVLNIDGQDAVFVFKFSGSNFQEFLEYLKESVHRNQRKYDPKTKLWRIYCSHSSMMRYCDTLEDMFPDIEIEWEYRFKPPMPAKLARITPDVIRAFQLLYVDVNAPSYVITAAYKALAKTYHPDRGHGDEEKMKQINIA